MRVLFAHWARPARTAAPTCARGARVEPVDRAAALRLRALWTVIGRFERLVGAEPLTVAERRATGR